MHVTRQFLDTSSPLDRFFEKNKKHDFTYGLGECVYQISVLYRFSLWLKGAVQTHKQTLIFTS